MKNIVFISPNFPTSYWMFCKELKDNGMNVLGIGDQPYYELTAQQTSNMTEYYKVGSLSNYEEVFKAVAFFSFKYGKIDWLESNNEFWLEQDAKLRTDFNITSGFQTCDMEKIKYKSHMKAYYEKAGIPVARYHLVDQLEDCLEFIAKVNYPVVVKPDNGVGASHTYKLKSDEDLKRFLAERAAEYPEVPFIMEEFVRATVNSYDAIFGPDGEPMFESGNVTIDSLMDVVNENKCSTCFIRKELPDDIRMAGRAAAKAFEVKNRFVHFEFFRLDEDQEGLGEAGDVVGLEVNMRPCGGFLPDMLNYANSTNVYKIWADMIAFGSSLQPEGTHRFCPFIGRRNGVNYVFDHDKIMEKYGPRIKDVMNLPVALSGAMGDVVYIALFEEENDMMEFYRDLAAEQ